MRQTLKSYLFWTYPRGSFHYDVMVTLILVFLFVSPRLINYRDRPQETLTSTKDILVRANGPECMDLPDWRRPARRYQQRRQTAGGATAAHSSHLRQCPDRPLSRREGCERTCDPISSVGTSITLIRGIALEGGVQQGPPDRVRSRKSCVAVSRKHGRDTGCPAYSSPLATTARIEPIWHEGNPARLRVVQQPVRRSMVNCKKDVRAGLPGVDGSSHWAQTAPSAAGSADLQKVISQLNTAAAKFLSAQADFVWDQYRPWCRKAMCRQARSILSARRAPPGPLPI